MLMPGIEPVIYKEVPFTYNTSTKMWQLTRVGNLAYATEVLSRQLPITEPTKLTSFGGSVVIDGYLPKRVTIIE